MNTMSSFCMFFLFICRSQLFILSSAFINLFISLANKQKKKNKKHSRQHTIRCLDVAIFIRTKTFTLMFGVHFNREKRERCKQTKFVVMLWLWLWHNSPLRFSLNEKLAFFTIFPLIIILVHLSNCIIMRYQLCSSNIAIFSIFEEGKKRATRLHN